MKRNLELFGHIARMNKFMKIKSVVIGKMDVDILDNRKERN